MDSACLGQRNVPSDDGIDGGFWRSTCYQEDDYQERERIRRIRYYESIEKYCAQEHQGPFKPSQEAIAKTMMIKERTRLCLGEQKRLEEEKAKEVQRQLNTSLEYTKLLVLEEQKQAQARAIELQRLEELQRAKEKELELQSFEELQRSKAKELEL
ncbi:OLC1v1005500C1 [Oldenlandia corymbosa var. corymbosa]|uniref:OLC1v1005500C1 n=1 Tax=Oldenlandia corymbosa var. corymbosa TaxID=529605 RepID=A0AAV1DI69_OLDCO|nr:OLC1v1005500C1 [Oldenlandia corymbosa var. corymbosa]